MHDARRNDLPPLTWFALENAERYELLAIDPRGATRFRDGTLIPAARPPHETAARENIDGFAVLGGILVSDRNTQRQLNQSLRKSINDWPNIHAGCIFQPRHGIRAKLAECTSELLICFHCAILKRYENGLKQGATFVDTPPPRLFNDLLTAANVPLDQGAFG